MPKRRGRQTTPPFYFTLQTAMPTLPDLATAPPSEEVQLSAPQHSVLRDGLIVLGVALAARLVFAVLIRGTYDYDEFVILLLGRDLSHGAVPYQDFRFFHPPGILVLMRALQPLIAGWWPVGRLVSVFADTTTAALVWVIGQRIFTPRSALAAGLLYALSPLALISSARIGQDPLMTLLGVAGLALLLRFRSPWAAVGAGILLALATWVKYPAVYFLPIYILAAPRRIPVFLPAAAGAFALLLLPLHAQLPQLYDETVTFQRTRWIMDTGTRIGTVLLYWLGLNVPALVGLWRTRRPLWLLVGFGLGALFILPSQVYYHYFVPIVPFAALLGAPPLAAVLRWSPLKLGAACAAVLGGWAAIINLGGTSPLFVTAARLSSIQPAVTLLREETTQRQPVLGDRYEYAYLAGRPALTHYFWNVGVIVDARFLERRVGRSGAVVLSHGASSGYPAGFRRYLDRRYPRIDTASATIWLTDLRET